MTNQQKGLLLIGLLTAWGGVMFYQMSSFSGTDSNPQSVALSTGNSNLPPIKDLSLDNAFPNSRQTAKFSRPRNIFASLDRSTKRVAKRNVPSPTVPVPDATRPPAPAPKGPSPEELAAQRARQQLNQFRFLGYLRKGGESQAFLTNGQAIYIVKQGEMLEGQVQVNKIEPETIVLSTQVWETGNQIQATIPLTPETNG